LALENMGLTNGSLKFDHENYPSCPVLTAGMLSVGVRGRSGLQNLSRMTVGRLAQQTGLNSMYITL
jgi:hypothetical protein